MNRVGLLAIVACVSGLGLGAVQTAASGNFTIGSYTHAREILDGALEAAGGAKRISALATVSWEQEGSFFARNQSPRSSKPFAENTQASRSILDLEDGWLVSEITNQFPTFLFRTRTVIKGEDKYTINLQNQTYQLNENLQAANFGFMHRLFPPLMLRKAVQQAASLRWLGEIELPPADLPKITELAEDIYIVEGLGGGGYNMLFAAFDDYILAMEAPLNSGVSSQAIAQIKEAVPDKPIRYLVLSHHHDDHSGGLRAFVTEGTTIVTTKANRAFFEQMASGTHTLAGNPDTREPMTPDFELIDGKRVFEDENHRLEIIDIGPSPHAEELFIAYAPKEKILFEADLLAVPRSGPIAAANEATVAFAEAVENLGLEVETLVGVHGTVGSMGHLELALAAGKSEKPAG